MSRTLRRTLFVSSLLALGCGPAVEADTDAGGSSSGTGGDSGDSGSTGVDTSAEGSGTSGGDAEPIALSVNADVDVLFVIDNSGSMGEAQANLVQDIGAFVGALESGNASANYRVAITTTDDSNYWCTGAGVSDAESGQFVLSSCRTRLGDFYFSGSDTNAEAACTDLCALEDLEIQPTTTDSDPSPSPRPWVESGTGQTNLPEGVSTTEALQCLLPQGINGCGFESPLESMWKSIKLIQNADQDEFGFMRAGAVLSVVTVTDEADCSFNRDHQNTVFGEEGVGNQVFWSLPDVQQAPTSAVCWNAGVTCDFSADSDQCVPVDLDVDGNPTTDADAAALYPVSKYTELVQEIENNKQLLDPGQEVLFAGIVGVPENYPNLPTLSYAPGPDATNPDSYQARYGIGPGCSSQVAEAVPPVRLRAFADQFLTTEDDSNLFSVCSNDYGPALEAIGQAIRDQIRPTCMPACVADTDAVSEGLQPSCVLAQEWVQNDGTRQEDVIPPCAGDLSVPADADVCWVERTTPDQMSPACVDEGWNLEVQLVRRAGVPAPAGVQVSASCQLSQNKAVDCPGLP